MAVTRGSTGHAAPRQAYRPESATSSTTKQVKKTAKKAKKAITGSKSTTTTTGTSGGPGRPRAKANTSHPRMIARSKVTKKKPTQKRTPTVKDKVEGAITKVVGTVTGKPGKRVCFDFVAF